LRYFGPADSQAANGRIDRASRRASVRFMFDPFDFQWKTADAGWQAFAAW
jgi:hypothetical protein